MAVSLLNLPKPSSSSHKGQNGVVLIIGGSKTYHGAPILAAIAAVRFCDLVYFSSTEENNLVMRRMKLSTPNVISLPSSKLKWAISIADCVLIGNGMDVGAATKRLTASVLRTGKRCVIDAAALRVLSRDLLHKNVIITPHIREFEAAFGIQATEKNISAMAEKYGCTILVKGKSDTIASPGKIVHVKGGNAGMTKGGTGDVLAGICAALFATNSSPLSAAYSASYLNKKAGGRLFRKKSYYFSSEDLALELSAAASALARRNQKT